MRNLFKFLFIIFLCSAIWLNFGAKLCAQKNKIKFEQLSIEQGLSQSTVFCIVQNKRGFMWFSTQDGLNKYNGYLFTIYKHDPDNSNSLSNNDVFSI